MRFFGLRPQNDKVFFAVGMATYFPPPNDI